MAFFLAGSIAAGFWGKVGEGIWDRLFQTVDALVLNGQNKEQSFYRIMNSIPFLIVNFEINQKKYSGIYELPSSLPHDFQIAINNIRSHSHKLLKHLKKLASFTNSRNMGALLYWREQGKCWEIDKIENNNSSIKVMSYE